MVVVTEDMCDLNGHMNVAYYLQAFDIYSRPMFEDFGFTKEHFKNGYSSFAVEDSIRYLKEFLLGEKIFPRFRLENFNKKLIHIVGILLNEEGQLSSISETVIVHVAMQTRQTVELPKAFQIQL
ncbi:MAG: thioesterase family protein, partial [Gammaproteobacteria bacterium]|nr:thioesterase family protein [Gammaproteobacteria bacterium]